MIKKKKVLICGCGNIAGKYNQNSKTSISLTHAHAIKNSKHFNIEACIDINKKNLKEFSHYWDIEKTFTSFSNLEASKYDLIVISTPAESHIKFLKYALSLNPQVIFIEKPVASTKSDISYLKTLKNNNICVNYSRAWDKSIDEYKSELIRSHYIRCEMSGDILNSASHMLHLMRNIFGNIKFSDIKKEKEIVLINFQTKNCLIEFRIFLNKRGYDLFEFTSFQSNGSISMLNNGLNWARRDPIKDSTYPDLRYLSINSNFKKGKYLDTLNNAYSNINAFIDTGEKLKCSLKDAINVEELLIQARDKL